jgi:hypothetical protein
MGSGNYAVRKPGETVQGQAPPQSGICTIPIEKFAESYKGSSCEPDATILNAMSELL